MAAGTTDGSASADLWQQLQDRLAFTSYVPVPVPADRVEVAAFVRRSGEQYHVLKQRDTLTYLSLPPDAYALWTMMDGVKPVRAIAVEYALAHRRLVTGLLRGLVDELREKGFLQDRPARLFSQLDERRQRRTVGYWLPALLLSVISRNLLVFRRGDAALGAFYDLVGWLFFTPAFVTIVAVLVVAGFAAWIAALATGTHSLVKTDESYVLGLVSLFVLDTLATSLHELGHALGVKHARRHVNDLGVLLYYGTPCAYVNTTDVWMADRRHRIITSLAGPFVSLVLAAIAGLVAYVSPPDSLAGDLAIKGATVWFFDGIVNFVPLLELDGYFMLVDLLDMPLLRARSFHFVRHDLWRKLRERASWTPEERILGLFGVLSATFSGLMLGLAAWVWQARGAAVASELWTLPAWYGKPLLALFLLVFVGPLLFGVVALAWSGMRGLWRTVSWHWRERQLARRVEPLLAALPYLRDASPAEQTALAEHLRSRRVAPGVAVVRQGDPADGFYFIRSGVATVEQSGEDRQPRRVATLGPGDHFGELAYLHHATRNATVRAETPLELYYLDGGHFHRWLVEEMRGSPQIRSRAIDLALLERLPMLAGLTPAERGLLIEHADIHHFEAGAVVFRQGDEGDRLYLIAEGRFEVSIDTPATDPDDEPADLAGALADARTTAGLRVAELTVGDHFGEIALLSDRPRTATVRALASSTCYSLTRPGFERLLAAAPAGRAGLGQSAARRLQQTRVRREAALAWREHQPPLGAHRARSEAPSP